MVQFGSATMHHQRPLRMVGEQTTRFNDGSDQRGNFLEILSRLKSLKIEQPYKLVPFACEFARTRIVKQTAIHPLSHRQLGARSSHDHCRRICVHGRKHYIQLDCTPNPRHHLLDWLETH